MRFPYDIDGLQELSVRKNTDRKLTLKDASLTARTELSLLDSSAFFGIAIELRELVSELCAVQEAIKKSEGFRVKVGKHTPSEALSSLGAAMRTWATTMAALSITRETWAEAVSHHSFSSRGEPREPVGASGAWRLGEVMDVEARTSTGPLVAVIRPNRLRILVEALETRFGAAFLNPEAALTSRGNTLTPLIAALPELAEDISGPALSTDLDPTFLGQSLNIDLDAEENTDLSDRLARALALPLQLVSSIRDVRAACGGIVDVAPDKWEKGQLLALGRKLPKEHLTDLVPPNLERLEQIQADIDKADALYRGQLLLTHLEELKRAAARLALSDRYGQDVDSALGLIGFDLGALGDLARSKDEAVKLTAKTALESAGRAASEDPKLMEILGPEGGQNRAFGQLISHSPLGLLEDGED